MTQACLTCLLPDCDETSPRCALRQAGNLMSRMTKKRLAHLLTPADRENYNAWFQMWKLDHDAQRADLVQLPSFSSPATQQEASFEGFFEG